MNKKKRLTEKEINEISRDIVKKSLKKIKNIISDQFQISILNNQEEIHPLDFINIIIISMTSIDVNMMLSLFDKCSDVDREGIRDCYLGNLIDAINREMQKLNNEKMN